MIDFFWRIKITNMSSNIIKIFQLLEEYYGDITRESFTKSWWPAKTPYEVMLGAILTQNTSWTSVEKVITALEGNITPSYIEGLSIEELEAIVHPSGFYTQKARRIKTITKWFKKFNYDYRRASDIELGELRADLLSLKGVGEETADAILIYALRRPSFVVDAYTRRIFSRFGIVVPKKYIDLKRIIEDNIQRDIDLYDVYHGLIVIHAKEFCKSKPDCDECPLKVSCVRSLP